MQLTDFGLSRVGLINSTDDLSGPSPLLGNDKPEVAVHSLQKREERKKHSVVGTPDYLAPEILLGMGHGLKSIESYIVKNQSISFLYSVVFILYCTVLLQVQQLIGGL